MKQFLYGFLVLFVFSSKVSAQADYTKDLSLPKGAEVVIVSIDKKNQMLEVNSVKFPGEDASWLKIVDFGKSVELDKGQDIRFIAELNKGNEKLIGRKFKLKKVITTYVHKSAFAK